MARPLSLRLVTAAQQYARAHATLTRAQARADRAAGLLCGAAAQAPDGRLVIGPWRVRLAADGGLDVRAVPGLSGDQLPLPFAG
ncbi:MAG TPA: hypothetical protein VMW47_10970 [Verrucomicrobiae bacterium]|nr:hypothetical protein [Verrucomicrobiae bacterium]